MLSQIKREQKKKLKSHNSVNGYIAIGILLILAGICSGFVAGITIYFVNFSVLEFSGLLRAFCTVAGIVTFVTAIIIAVAGMIVIKDEL